MKSMKRTLIASTFAGLIGFGLALLYQRITDGRETTTSRLSPDETTLARLVETSPSWAIDRNFAVRLESLVGGSSRTIFRSPDEGKPPGTERLIWSKDGTKLLLVGRHFFVKEDLFLDNGDQLYFLYDVPSGNFLVNSHERPDLPPLKAGTIEGIEFTEPIRLRSP
jgi:hypothetical protein